MPIFLSGAQTVRHRLSAGDPESKTAFPQVCNSIINTFRGISAEMVPLKVIKCFGGADKTNCSDGDKVVLIAGVGVVFLDDIGDEAQIVDYQLIARGVVSLGNLAYTFRLVLGGKLFGELISPLKMQPENQKVMHSEFNEQGKHNKSSYTLRQTVFGK